MWRHDALTTYPTCPPDSVRKVKSVDSFRDKPSPLPLTTTSATTKLPPTNDTDQQPLLELKDAAYQKPFVIVVSGASNVGKSAVIKLAHHKLRLVNAATTTTTTTTNTQSNVHALTIEDMTYPVQLIELSIDLFDTKVDPLQLPKDIPKVDGGLICFDLTNKDSMDCLPDLLNLFHSLQIPLFLLGLKSDLTALRQVDAHLASNLGKLFNAPFSEINSFSLHCSRRLVEICANIVLSCTAGKRQDMECISPPITFNKQQPNKSPLTLRERRLVGEPIMKIGTSSTVLTKPVSHGKQSPKNLASFCTSSSPPDQERHYPVDSMRSPRPQASKSMPSARIRNDYPANGDCCTPNTSLSSSRLSPTFPSHKTTTPGFVYAPTQSAYDNTTLQHLPSPLLKPLPSLPNTTQNPTSVQYSPMTSNTILESASSLNDLKRSKRSSKDSGESFSPGMTIEDIIDRLTQVTDPSTDEKFTLVFMTFFRRFMKPGELVEILTERFGSDMNAMKLPTPQQHKIHDFFCQWLSTYWGDFCSVQTRKLMMLHLDHLSQHTDLRPMCDELAPLVIREPPSNDPDTRWGLYDTEDSVPDPSTPATSYAPCKVELGKKDSGYIGSFDSEQFLDIQSPVLQPMPTENSDRMQRPDHPPKSFSNGPNVQRPRNPPHMHSSPPPRYQEPFKSKPDPMYERNKWQQEFAGGLVNIDAHTRHGPNSSAASIMSTLAGSTRPEKDLAQVCFKTFTNISDEALADQLTWIEAELFHRIKPRQLIRNVWSTKARRQFTNSVSSLEQLKSPASKESFTPSFNTHPSSCPVLASIAHFNFISAWVSTMIVMQLKLSRRGKTLEKFMHVAVALRNRNNYNTLMAVLAGINSAAVLRLRHTRDWVSVKKIYKQFQSLERLMSTDRSFGSYRLALKASEAPGIPYLGIHNQDLLSLAEANKDFKMDGTIHWEKFRLMGETILAMIRFQEPRFSIQPDARILGFIAETELMNEDEQFRQSMVIEPRLKTAASSNRLRDLWFRV